MFLHMQTFSRPRVFLWKGSEADLFDFHHYMNTTNTNIKLSLAHSRQQINFLDLTIFKGDNRLHTTICKKPTDSNTILHTNSFHPPRLSKNIPYGQLLHLRHICDQDQDLLLQSQAMSDRLREYHYKPHLITP